MNIKTCYGALLMGLAGVVGKDAAKKFDTRLRFHRKLNLKNPTTLADKIVYIENHCPSELTPICADKWEVREYVKQKGYEHLLIPVYGQAYSGVAEIPFDLFPDRFVLKATHGCKMNFFCADKASLDVAACRKVLKQWMKTPYGTYSGEWHYLQIPHRIYCEHYLDDCNKMIDYKFHCLNGVPVFVQVNSERDASGARMEVNRNLFNMSWQPIDGLTDTPGKETQCPGKFQQMKEIAASLSGDFPYVRVDLYEIQGKVYFSELTFTPQSGVFPHFKETFLAEMGKKLNICEAQGI